MLTNSHVDFRFINGKYQNSRTSTYYKNEKLESLKFCDIL